MVKVRIPATTANMGPGFDTFGLSLALYNTVEVQQNNSNDGITMQILGDSTKSLENLKHNLVIISAQKVFDRVGFQAKGLHFILENKIPVSHGLGSSAAAIVGGLFAANEICGKPFSRDELFEMAVEIEGHPDNVAPAVYGGFVISCMRDGEDTLVMKARAPERLKYVVAIPDFYLSTRMVREAIPEKILVRDAVFNLQRASMLVGAMLTDDLELFSNVVEDRIHQPYRYPHINGCLPVLKAMHDNGALAEAISGSGPSLIAFCTEDKCEAVRLVAEDAWREQGVKCYALTLEQDVTGAMIFE